MKIPFKDDVFIYLIKNNSIKYLRH